jgi:hypothetical protein
MCTLGQGLKYSGRSDEMLVVKGNKGYYRIVDALLVCCVYSGYINRKWGGSKYFE